MSTQTITHVNVTHKPSLKEEALTSLQLFIDAKLNILFIFGPIAFIGSSTGILGEALCFILSGLALIPCAERLSFVTEQVAIHTNETFGALLNATFGNAPEFLISAAALKNEFYRIVQLTLLGSMLTNLLFVFGLSCTVGGMKWQVQTLRITSGNVGIGMLLLVTMGLVLPASLKLANESKSGIEAQNGNGTGTGHELTASDVTFSRVNALVMAVAYVLYLIFQLGSHKDEFDYDGDDYAAFGGGHNIIRTTHYNYNNSEGDSENPNANANAPQDGRRFGHGDVDGRTTIGTGAYDVHPCHSQYTSYDNTHRNHPKKPKTKVNVFCAKYCRLMRYCPDIKEIDNNADSIEMQPFQPSDHDVNGNIDNDLGNALDIEMDDFQDNIHARVPVKNVASNLKRTLTKKNVVYDDVNIRAMRDYGNGNGDAKINVDSNGIDNGDDDYDVATFPLKGTRQNGILNANASAGTGGTPRKKSLSDRGEEIDDHDEQSEVIMSMRMGLVWLALVTIAISILSDIIVETIDGFASRSNVSEVFTSVVIIPYFSNIAEQVSAVIFAYKNKMDLCIGVTVGSAIQIGQFVMPGCVLVGWWMDKDMTLYFRGYETVCLLLGVLCTAAVLQGGTTNWLVGIIFMGVYVMIAAGFALHEVEDLSG